MVCEKGRLWDSSFQLKGEGVDGKRFPVEIEKIDMGDM